MAAAVATSMQLMHAVSAPVNPTSPPQMQHRQVRILCAYFTTSNAMCKSKCVPSTLQTDSACSWPRHVYERALGLATIMS
jgi:hypothetical protein